MRKILRFLASIALLSAGQVAFCDEAAVQKYRNFTPEQLRQLSEKELESEVPMLYSMAARTGLSVGSELLFAMELNLLMYPGLHDFKGAVRAFQRDLGDEETGIFTVWEISQLQQRAEMQRLGTLSFPQTFSSYISSSYASIEGTVAIIDDSIMWPINHMKITCIRQEGVCTTRKLYLDTPRESSWAQMFHVGEDIEETYTIIRWTADSIDSAPLGTNQSCRTTSLSFNFKTKEFYFITRNAGGDCTLPLGGELEMLSKPRIAQVLDGKETIESEFAEIQERAYSVLSSDFRKRVDALRESEAKK